MAILWSEQAKDWAMIGGICAKYPHNPTIRQAHREARRMIGLCAAKARWWLDGCVGPEPHVD
jgi:hypothetical protein